MHLFFRLPCRTFSMSNYVIDRAVWRMFGCAKTDDTKYMSTVDFLTSKGSFLCVSRGRLWCLTVLLSLCVSFHAFSVHVFL